jgi:hypothetical protein
VIDSTPMGTRLLNSTVEQGWKLIEKPLEKVSKSEFADLNDGHYIATFTDPNGYKPEIHLLISGSRARARRICLDLHTGSCNWNLRPVAVEKFRRQYETHHPSKIKRVTHPFLAADARTPPGDDQLTFSITRGEEGEWLYRAAQLLTNPQNLVRLTFP